MFNRFTRTILFGGLMLLLVVAVACGGVASASPARQTSATPAASAATATSDIGVTGTGRVFAKPDTAIASVGVEATASTLATATVEVNTRMTAVLAKIKSLGVDDKDITTINYNVSPITSNPKEGETPRITGYHVSNLVQIKIRKLDSAGTILDAAVAAGANSLSNLYFTIDDPSALQQQARTKAVQDAMAKAKTLAEAANVKLGPITAINEDTVRPQPLYDRTMLAAPAATGMGSGPGPVETGQLEIAITVEMHYQIAQ